MITCSLALIYIPCQNSAGQWRRLAHFSHVATSSVEDHYHQGAAIKSNFYSTFSNSRQPRLTCGYWTIIQENGWISCTCRRNGFTRWLCSIHIVCNPICFSRASHVISNDQLALSVPTPHRNHKFLRRKVRCQSLGTTILVHRLDYLLPINLPGSLYFPSELYKREITPVVSLVD